MTDDELLITGTLTDLERRIAALEQQERFMSADDFACLNGLWPDIQQCNRMAHKMRDRIAELEDGRQY